MFNATMMIRLAVIGTAALLAAAAARGGPVIFVDAAAPPGGDGTGWDTAYHDLQDALAQATPGKEIWVATGLYTPAPPGGDRDISFQLKTGVALYGGFAGDEQFLNERDWIANPTILSGDLNGDDGPQFQYHADNSYNVLKAGGTDDTALLDGFVITAGYADGPDDGPLNWRRGAGMWNQTASPTIIRCAFRWNWADNHGGAIYNHTSSNPTIFDSVFQSNVGFLGSGGAIYNYSSSDPIIADCLFVGNESDMNGGAVYSYDADPTIIGCTFSDNTAEAAGAVMQYYYGLITIADSTFVGNFGSAIAGAVFASYDAGADISGCQFLENVAEIDGGALILASYTSGAVTNCTFLGNDGGRFAGGLLDTAQSVIVNCAFSGNIADGLGQDLGGGAALADGTTFINCSFSRNTGAALETAESGTVLRNCILWENTPQQIQDMHDPSTVCYSDIQGGWSGPGYKNIDADPLFVQPGADDLRLAFGSPCVNKGDTSAVPDGVDTDLAGNPRVIDGVVDMGAYEGEYEPLPPADADYDFDEGDAGFFIPEGGEYDPVNTPCIAIMNIDAGDDSTVIVTQHEEDVHPEAEGFTESASVLALDTTMQDGGHVSVVSIAFEAADLDGIDPLTLDLTYFDEESGNWALAVSRNTHDSPGFDSPIGDRIVVVGGDEWGLTGQYGDYGVFWDPDEKRGFAWAQVDYGTDFAAGAPLCPPDCAQPPDGAVRVEDLVFVLQSWGRGPGPFDVNDDGIVNMFDLVHVLNAWGACP